MSHEQHNPNHESFDRLSHAMMATLGATIVSMSVSLSTHHVHLASHGPISTEKLSHAFEREREVLHGHTNLGRMRAPTVAGPAS